MNQSKKSIQMYGVYVTHNCTFQDDEREGTGLECVQCVCQRWLHEECVCEIEYDEEGRELLCPFCAIQV